MSIQIDLLGQLSLGYEGENIALPSSKKTRALLAYLALTQRAHSRERLCELLWDSPDDPRGALRWALSKLRGALDSDGPDVILSDRDHVKIDVSHIELDIHQIKEKLTDDASKASLSDIKEMVQKLNHVLLDGLDMPNQTEFQSWLVAQREDARLLMTQTLKILSLSSDLEDGERVKWTRKWLDAQPLSEAAALANITALRRVGRFDDANRVVSSFRELARKSQISVTDNFDMQLMQKPLVKTEEAPESFQHKQSIGFCKASDGVSIAYATVGNGPPLVKAANWLNHLDLDWDSPIWGDTFRRCASHHTFIRYDERGNGLSDWDVEEISQRKFVEDLETVVDHLNIEKFPLLGISQGCAVSIEYAVRHPERVSALILVSGYASGWRIGASLEEQEKREAVLTLTKHGWGTNNSAYRQIFSQTFMPDAPLEDLEWFNEFQRKTTSAENAVRFQNAFGHIDVRELLPQVKVPTIVFHATHDQRITLDQGRELAVGIPNARFVPLESRNHIILGHEAAWAQCFNEIDQFLAEHNI